MTYQYRREPITSDEADRLVKCCKSAEEKLVVWTLLETGLRVSEVAGLTKDSVDTQSHRLTVYGKGSVNGRRGAKRRVIQLSGNLRTILEPHLISNETFGVGVRKMQYMLRRVAKRANIQRPVSPHVCRHYFAVQALKKGISLRTLMELLGHNNLTTTAIYLNLAPEDALREFESKW